MNEIEQVLHRAARSVDQTAESDVVDADLRRGRSALLRRRRRRAVWSSAGSTLAAAAIVATTIVVGGSDGSSEAPPVQADGAKSRDAAGADGGVHLVSYTGEQAAGFTVDKVPEGWAVQDSEHSQYYLTIAPKGDTSSPDIFEDKLAVMLDTRWPHGLPKGEPVEVNGRPGVIFRYDPAGDQLIFEYGDGRMVVVQSWNPVLDWYDDQLVSFAEGITVTSAAKATSG